MWFGGEEVVRVFEVVEFAEADLFADDVYFVWEEDFLC